MPRVDGSKTSEELFLEVRARLTECGQMGIQASLDKLWVSHLRDVAEASPVELTEPLEPAQPAAQGQAG